MVLSDPAGDVTFNIVYVFDTNILVAAFLSRDPGDDMVLECALNGGAAAIITRNGRDFLPEAERFGIDVLLPGRFLVAFEQSRRTE